MAKRVLQKLNTRVISNLSKKGRIADGGGLYLAISASGCKAWVFLFSQNGRAREMGLGSLVKVPLAEARKKAAEYRTLLGQGLDPIENNKKEKAHLQPEAVRHTFGEVATMYIKSKQASWKSTKHRNQVQQTLVTYASSIWKMPVDAVDKSAVLKVIEPIWLTTQVTGERTLGRIASVLDFAGAHGWTAGENPARYKGFLDHILPKRPALSRKHHPAMPYLQLISFMQELRANPSMPSQALQFLVLTGARSAEVLEGTWDEIDRIEATWSVPAVRMKGNRDHLVPLSLGAIKILNRVGPPHPGFIFPSRKRRCHISGTTLSRLVPKPPTVHGMRSSLRDWAGDCTNFSREVAEACLAHRVGSAVEQAYRRSSALDKRRQLMDAWSLYLGAHSGPVTAQDDYPEEWFD
jgi:integrase